MLDLMTLCWSHDPNRRPSANQIVELSSRAEFTQLCSSWALGEGVRACAAVCAPHHVSVLDGDVPDDTDVSDMSDDVSESCDVWMSVGSGKHAALAIYSINKHGCLSAKVFYMYMLQAIRL